MLFSSARPPQTSQAYVHRLGRRRRPERRLGFRTMRSVVIAAAVTAVTAAPAQATSIQVSPPLFSPTKSALTISASLQRPLRVGIQLAEPDGRAVGWIARPARRLRIARGW